MGKRDKLLPLTETTFYILLALNSPSHGYQIMETVEDMSNGDVRIAAGTMYGALENLLKQKLICPQSSNDPRRKVYAITERGMEILKADVCRLRHMLGVAETLIGKEGSK
jgi:DNA-binding PadR family transcriptional regulator